MPITSQELKDLITIVKNLQQQLEGLQQKAEAEYGHPRPEGEPQARPYRIR